MAEKQTAARMVRPTISAGWTGSRPSPNQTVPIISRPPTEARMPIGSQPVSASRSAPARPARARGVIGRTTRKTEIPNTHRAMAKNIGANPRP